MVPESVVSSNNVVFNKENDNTKKYVIFKLNKSFFGIKVEHVIQILNVNQIFNVPGTKDYLMGVINHRGKIVTLIDLRKRLNLEGQWSLNEKEDNIMIINFDDQLIGLYVDQVLALRSLDMDLLNIDFEGISAKVEREFLIGTITNNGELIKLFDLNILFSDYDHLDETSSEDGKTLKNILNKDKEEIKIPQDQMKELNLEES